LRFCLPVRLTLLEMRLLERIWRLSCDCSVIT
jgi:hypothetical protein